MLAYDATASTESRKRPQIYLKRQLGQLGTTIILAYDATASTESEVNWRNKKKLFKLSKLSLK